MDSTSNWRDKLTQFRIRELKDVLTQLGFAKQGKKQELMERIICLLSDEQGSKVLGWGKKNSIGKEGILKIIDDTYRKMQIPVATDLASKSLSNSEFNIKPKEEVEDSYQCNIKVRCLCGISTNTQLMIKCEDTRCRVSQHINCVIVPEKPVEGVQPELPSRFYCEICRINRADPFWATLSHPLHPIKLNSYSPASDGSMTVQNTERTFKLSRADRELLQRTDYDLQVWCILVNDKVPFRMQWPQHIDLQVNGYPVRTINRPATQLLGINGRDDGSVITTCSREGLNKISLSRADARIFCFGIRIARRRTLQQVLGLVPKELEGEKFEDALARVHRCIGGTNEKGADSDSDLEVVAENVTVNLRCPMSGSRIKIAGRFKPCIHMGCFDLETFVELNQRSRKWQCPICLKNYSLDNVIIDPYFNRITSLMRNCGEDVNEIEVKPDGSWRAKNEGNHMDLGRWHLPDGSIDVRYVEKKTQLDNLKKVKQEGSSDGQTSLRFKRNLNGVWEVRKTGDVKTHYGSRMTEKYDTYVLNIPMSSSAAGSYRDGEDHSVNQEGGGHVDFSSNNGHEFNSSRNFDFVYNVNGTSSAPDDLDIIVLSDSEEDLTLISPDAVYDTHPPTHTGDPFSVSHPVIPELYPEEHGVGPSGPNILDNNEDYVMPLWPLPTCSQTVSGFQLFSTDVVVPDAMATTVQSDPIGFATVDGYDLAPDGGRGNSFFMDDIPVCPTTEVNGSLVDNPLAFVNEDPALQIFFPSRPAIMSTQADMNEQNDMSNVISTDDWISLRLGGAGATQNESAIAHSLYSTHQFHFNEGSAEPVVDTASLLLNVKNEKFNEATQNCKRSDGPFSHPRQPRSVRSRPLSIDTDFD